MQAFRWVFTRTGVLVEFCCEFAPLQNLWPKLREISSRFFFRQVINVFMLSNLVCTRQLQLMQNRTGRVYGSLESNCPAKLPMTMFPLRVFVQDCVIEIYSWLMVRKVGLRELPWSKVDSVWWRLAMGVYCKRFLLPYLYLFQEEVVETLDLS